MFNPVDLYKALIETRNNLRGKGFKVPHTSIEDFIRRLEQRRSKNADNDYSIQQHPRLRSQQLAGTNLLTVYESVLNGLVSEEQLGELLQKHPELAEKLAQVKSKQYTPSTPRP